VNRAGETTPAERQSLFNATLISVAIQVGCLTLVLIFLSLVTGLILDRVLDTRPLFTIIFLVGSMPLTWVAVFWVVNRAKHKLDPPKTRHTTGTEKRPPYQVNQEEDYRDE
jgi:F0F1-type ATP synthase assembly protein I